MPSTADMFQEKDSPGYLCKFWRQMNEVWRMIEDLNGGTEAMRDAGIQWLPREKREAPRDYERRLERTFLYGGYESGKGRILSKPFSRPVTIEGDLPKALDGIESDVDLEGTSLTSFARKWMENALDYGVSHVLVDYPITGEGTTLSDKRERKIRPYFIHVTPRDLIGWRSEKSGGERVLTQVRIREVRVEADGAFGEKEVEYIRVITPGKWELYRKTDERNYVPAGEGDMDIGVIPLVTLNLRSTGFMTARPVLEKLAWKNIEHWQSSSDQNNILKVVRFATMIAKGFDKKDLPKIVIGPHHSIRTTDKDAHVGFVEHTGKGVDAGWKHIERLEEQMEILGLRHLVKRTQNSTATGKAIDESQANSDAQVWVGECEDQIDNALALAAKWENTEIADGVVTNIFSDFRAAMGDINEIKEVRELRKDNQITLRVAVNEYLRRGLISDAVDVDEMLQELEEEQQSRDVAMMGETEDDNDVSDDDLDDDFEEDEDE
jgi:hypothetical protein